MKGIRNSLAIAVLFVTLVVLAYFGTTMLVGPIWFLYRTAPGLGTARSVAQIAAWIGTAGLFVSGAIVAVPLALEPAKWSRKWLYILPAYLLGFTLAGVVANIFEIGTVGSIFGPPPAVRITFAIGWLSIGAVLGTLALVIATSRANLSDRIQRMAMRAISITGVPALIVVLAMLISVGIVMTNQPRVPGLDTGNAPPAPGGQDGPAFPGVAGFVTQFQIGSGLMTVFAIIAGIGIVGGLRRLRAMGNESSAPTPVNYRSEIIPAMASVAAITLVLVFAIQLIPVSRTNPPVQAAVEWDSAQTKDLVTRTCMNCHSNETQWRWYSYIAPSSWLNVIHVNAARQRYNLSELNKLTGPRKTRLARDMGEAIRNGNMPPKDYLLLHPEAQLTDAEKQQLIQGLVNSIK